MRVGLRARKTSALGGEFGVAAAVSQCHCYEWKMVRTGGMIAV